MCMSMSRKKYNDYHIVYICNTYNDMVERLDGYIYGIMDKDGKVICDLAEPRDMAGGSGASPRRAMDAGRRGTGVFLWIDRG